MSVASLVLATLVVVLGPAAFALEPGSAASLSEPISFSADNGSAELVWLPYRPTAGELRKGATAEVVPAEFRLPARPSQAEGDDPMANPFGDRRVPSREPRASVGPRKNVSLEFIDPSTLSDGSDPSTGQQLASQGVPSDIPKKVIEDQMGRGAGNRLEPKALPSLEEELATNAPRDDGCPEKSGFKPINELTTDIRAESGEFPRECLLEETAFVPRAWSPTTFTWQATGLCHKPLYFEQVQLERYGHSFGPYVQPILSAGHFFVTVPVVPYLMGVNPPNECLYTLGYYRPGSCAPYMLDPLPLSIRGALWETAAVIGGVYLIP